MLLSLSSCEVATPETDELHPPPVTYDGKNRALRFDGQTDYVTTGTAAFPFPTAPQTVALWVRMTDASSAPADAAAAADQTLVALRKDFDSGLTLGLRAGSFEVWNVYSKRTFVRSPAAAKKNVWQYVAYTFDGTDHRLYVDGQPAGEGEASPNNRTPTSGWLGSIDGSSAFFVGEMDELRIYETALPSSALLAQATRGRAPSAPIEQADALVLWLGFDEVSGFRAKDRSSRKNDALLGDGIASRAPERFIDEP